MKTLKDYLSKDFKDEVEVISATDLRANLGECLTLVKLGKTYCVKRKGKIVAFLTLKTNVIHTIKSDGSCDTLDLD